MMLSVDKWAVVTLANCASHNCNALPYSSPSCRRTRSVEGEPCARVARASALRSTRSERSAGGMKSLRVLTRQSPRLRDGKWCGALERRTIETK
jgi:hypothetical protein